MPRASAKVGTTPMWGWEQTGWPESDASPSPVADWGLGMSPVVTSER